MIGNLATRLQRDLRGATIMEFAFVLPVFITMMVGMVCAAHMMFAMNSLHFAVQDAARCASVKTTICTDAATTRTYAQSKYAGPNVSQVFTYSTAGCGHTVTASGSYTAYLGVGSVNFPLSAAACYP